MSLLACSCFRPQYVHGLPTLKFPAPSPVLVGLLAAYFVTSLKDLSFFSLVMRPVVPGFLVDLGNDGAPLSAIVVDPLSGMVCIPVVERVVSPPAVKVFSPFPSIYPGFRDVSLSSRIPPL